MGGVDKEYLAADFEIDALFAHFGGNFSEENFEAVPAFVGDNGDFILAVFTVVIVARVILPMTGDIAGGDSVAVEVGNEEIVNLAFEWDIAWRFGF